MVVVLGWIEEISNWNRVHLVLAAIKNQDQKLFSKLAIRIRHCSRLLAIVSFT